VGRHFNSDKLFAGAPEFLVAPLLMGPVFLISQGRRFEQPVRPCPTNVDKISTVVEML